jgi:defect-in-organelle-trafficking protein DotB
MNQVVRLPDPSLVVARDDGLWPGGAAPFTRDTLDSLFEWAFRHGASDIRVETHKPVFVQMHGRMCMATRRSFTEREVEEAVNRLYGAEGVARLKRGEDFDVSYEVQPDRRTRFRFRVNATAVLAQGDDGGAVVARALPVRSRRLSEQDVEPEIVRACMPRTGLVFIAGGTGNGKSTLQAGITRGRLEDPDSHVAILEYSSPIEFTFDDVVSTTATISQSEIPRHLPSFAAGIRNAMRRAGDVIIIGECRDGETMAAAAQAALTDHAVYSTIHAGTLSETVQRIVSLCPLEERAALTVAVAQTLRLIVNQRLVSSLDGTRTALREFLAFDRPMRRRMADTNPDRWPALIEDMLAEGRGQSFERAIQRALAEGRISGATAAGVREDLGDVA